MQQLSYTGLFLLLPLLVTAQYSPTIVSGRPGQSFGAATVGRGVYQMQTGLNLQYVGSGSNKLLTTTETTDLRIGVLERFEISALIAGAAVEEPTLTGSRYDRGFSDTQIGGRYLFFEQSGWRPTLSVRSHALLTLQDENFRREKVGALITVIAEWSLNDLFSVTTNLGRIWTGEGTRSTDYVLTLGQSLSDRWSSFVEVYGSLSEFTTNYDGGFAYLLTDDVQLDASAGFDGVGDPDSYFFDFGISFRFVAREPIE